MWQEKYALLLDCKETLKYHIILRRSVNHYLLPRTECGAGDLSSLVEFKINVNDLKKVVLFFKKKKG